MIQFKSPSMADEFEKTDKRLQIICFSVDGFLNYYFDKSLFITSIYRPENKLSIHAYWRGIDARITPKGGAPTYSDEEIKAVQAYCRRFRYSKDPKKKKYTTLKVHDSGSGLHFHFQVNWNSATEILR